MDNDAGAGDVLPEDQALIDRYEAGTSTVTTTIPASHQREAWWSTDSAMTMCALILVFGILVIAISSVLALKRLEQDVILKVVTIPMTVMSAIFLVVAGYSDSQVAPAMGLLGTIVGYVLGTTRSNATLDSRAKPPEPSGESSP